MALKTFTPFVEGAEIKSDDFNNTYKTNGLEGTITSLIVTGKHTYQL